MRDWVVAIVLGTLLAGAVFALPVLAALISVLLTPALFLVAAILGIWFFLQVLKDDDNSRDGKRPDP